MMNHTLKNQYKVNPGTIIVGKWHAKKYTIVKELGFGANGVVYLARFADNHVALKMSENGMSITSEVNVLKSFAKVQGSALGPSLLDVDDYQMGRGQISFYVMEYIQGPNLLTFIEQKGKSWSVVLFLQLLNDLDKLHQNGWVFGDLKPENLIVTGPPPKIRCIDVGGTTIQGRAIKEFTEFYDRGYWGLGSRKAEPTYDLFAVAMIMINTAYPKRFEKTIGGLVQLQKAISLKPELKSYEKVIMKALQGYYLNAKQMRTDLLDLIADKKTPAASLNKRVANSSPSNSSGALNTNIQRNYSRQDYRKKKKKSGWMETVMVIAVMFLLLGLGAWYITTK